jgi:antitoxin PrlF
VVSPKPVLDILSPGDEFAFVISCDEVRVMRAATAGEDPFVCFTEWATEADREGFAEL